MSTITTQGEFDFWEFVSCGICHLEFVKESGSLSTTPFWLTECGHVVCNSHLKPDQSCAECGNQEIQVLPLAREMEPPMSNWFESATLAFDAVGYALRFQINTLTSLVRYFKRKYMQYRPLYDRLKEEHAETKRLKKMVDDLQKENQQLKLRLQANVGDRVNDSNKRQRIDEDGRYVFQRTSSPRSVTSVPTPIGPDRLTLPPDHHPPQFNSRQPLRTYASTTPRRNLSQYAYAPPRSAQTQTIAAPTLSHVQSRPTQLAQAREHSEIPNDQQTMPPPPVPAVRTTDPRFRKSTLSLQPETSGLPQQPSNHPPSTPQISCTTNFRFTPQTPMRTTTASVSTTSRAFVPGPHHHHPQQHRFLPVQRTPTLTATSNSVSLAAAGTVSQTASKSPVVVSGSGGQRTPFVPGTAGGRS